MVTTHFENVDLLKSLMGGGRPQVPASRRPAPAAAAATAASPPPPTAAPRVEDGRPSHDALGIFPAPFPTAAGGLGPKREALPPPYQSHASPTPPPAAASSAGAGSVGTVSAPCSPALSLASLPGYEAQPPASPGTTTTTTTSGGGGPSSPGGLPGAPASSGLKALFQVPVPLGGFREGPTTPTTRRRQSAPAPAPGREPPPALASVTSVASFRSLVAAEGGGGDPATATTISELEGDSCHRLAPRRPASYSGGGGGARRLGSPLPPQTGTRLGGRSQFFVYKPRLAPAALAADVISESPADALVFELDGAGVGGPQGPAASSGGSGGVVESAEGEEDAGGDAAGSTGEERPKQGSRSTVDVSGVGNSQVPGPRNEVESAAWHRRTKMFQV